MTATTLDRHAGQAAPRPGIARTAAHLAVREVRTVLRTPAALVPSLAIPVFIYLVTIAMFEGYAAQFGITGWEAFMIPVAVLFAVSNGSAGQNLVADIERGYFDKILTTPTSRLALLLGAMAGDLLRIAAQSALALAVGVLVAGGLATGVSGALALIGLAAYWGLAYTAIGFAVAIRTGNAQATESTFLLFFPLMFLSPAFAPREAMADWLAAAVAFNPMTYILEAMRTLTVHGWDREPLVTGVAVTTAVAAVTLSACLLALRGRVR